MQPRFEQFIKERQYFTNVTPRTVEWYRHGLKWRSSESPTDSELKNVVFSMRETGLKETGCNSVIREINSYLHWSAAGVDRKCGPACQKFLPAGLPHFRSGSQGKFVFYRNQIVQWILDNQKRQKGGVIR
jgi:hypothetical protein